MQRHPNWYLDPIVAHQKQLVHLDWFRRNLPDEPVSVLLKTDLFEEAHGEDQLLFGLPLPPGLKIGMDLSPSTTRQAAAREGAASGFLTADVRRLPLRKNSVDLVLSNSTLDHFDSADDIKTSIVELARVLKPGGRLLITLDNPHNPFYWSLRALSNRLGLSFQLGQTLSRKRLLHLLEETGLEVLSTDWLLHNPRFVSTALFLGTRRLLGKHADPLVRAWLWMFALGGRLPTRGLSAVFIAACGRKRPIG
jgi:SAM-dependent methyltransferase